MNNKFPSRIVGAKCVLNQAHSITTRCLNPESSSVLYPPSRKDDLFCKSLQGDGYNNNQCYAVLLKGVIGYSAISVT